MTGRLSNTAGILQKKKKKLCAPPPKKNPGSTGPVSVHNKKSRENDLVHQASCEQITFNYKCNPTLNAYMSGFSLEDGTRVRVPGYIRVITYLL